MLSSDVPRYKSISPHLTHHSLVLAGRYAVYRSYTRPYAFQRPYLEKGSINVETSLNDVTSKDRELILKNRVDNMSRARNNLFYLICSNVDAYDQVPKIITLTFKNQTIDNAFVNASFAKFNRRLGEFIGVRPLYVAVVEPHKSGNLHIHALYFNVPFIDKSVCRDLWGLGHIRLEAFRPYDSQGGQIKIITSYLTKYFTKDMISTKKRFKKSFLTSHGLQRFKIIADPDMVDTLLDKRLKTHESLKTDVTNCKQFGFITTKILYDNQKSDNSDKS